MKSLDIFFTEKLRSSYRILPSTIQLFIPFSRWITPVNHEAGKLEKYEACKICGTLFSIEDPYCPHCAHRGIHIHITKE